MGHSFCQRPVLPSFETEKTIIIRKICLVLILLATISGIFYSLLGKYNYLFLVLISYVGGGVALHLLQRKKLNLAKLWLIMVFSFRIIISAFLFGAASYAPFLIIFIPFAAMVFYHEQQYLWRYILLAITSFFFCEGIIFYTEPIVDIAFPFIHKCISGLAIILSTYLLLDLFKVEILKKEAILLSQNLLLKKEIDERKRVETVLVANEERLKLAIETANLAVRDVNIKTGEIFIGEQYACIFEYDKELFLSGEMKLSYLIHEEDKPYFQTLIENQLSGNTSNYDATFRIYTKSGSIKWIQQLSKTITVDKHGKPERIIQMCMDVTAQRAINITLEKKNKKLKEFSSIASHDMREPLRMICSFSQALKRSNSHQLDANGLEYLGFIENASLRMSVMLDDLLKYARVGIPEKAKQLVNLNRVLVLAKNNLGLKIQETKAKIQVAELPNLMGYQTFFLQIFQNLLANALKFRKAGTVPIIDISYQKCATEYVFAIKDNGIGMEQKQLKSIFKAFHRLHNRDKYEGSGLGLATCAELIKLMNGRIWAESKLDLGTTFYMALPKVKVSFNSTKMIKAVS